MTIYPVVLSGGAGTRLWPLSRAMYPKQFIRFFGESEPSFLGSTLKRLSSVEGCAAPTILCNNDHRFLVRAECDEAGIAPRAIILEPQARNTAPAIAAAAVMMLAEDPKAVMCVMPSDHVIKDADAFVEGVKRAAAIGSEGRLVLFGIRPDEPHTGFGYIQSGEPLAGGEAFAVKRFAEKPDAATAERYVESGEYLWNSGIFVLHAATFIAELRRFEPKLVEAVEAAVHKASHDLGFVRLERGNFAAAPSISVDYAVMEHCPGSAFDIRMVPLDAGWNDLGAWDAVWQVAAKDAAGNSGVGDVMFEGSRNTLVHATGRLVTAVGLENVVIVETADAVLVADRERSQDVKKLVSRLDSGKRTEHTVHRKVHRPWGWYDSVDAGARFQVKRIMVKPGASLSLQMHHHRAEHWIVVQGTAEVTCGERVMILTENQSTYIPLGETHRLANPGKLPLEIIEVQSGSYLGEDDIVRFEDTYGRTN